MIRRSLRIAREAGCDPVVVVTGAFGEIVERELKGSDAKVVHNDHWEEGMGSSIRCGLQYLLDVLPEARSLLVLLVDQPLVDAGLLRKLRKAFQNSHHSIAACRYKEKPGVPAIFGRSLFGDLLELEGPAGARAVLRDADSQLVTIPFPGGSFDLDTPEDWTKWQTGNVK